MSIFFHWFAFLLFCILSAFQSSLKPIDTWNKKWQEYFIYLQEEFEDTKGVIRICKSKKDRRHNGQKKKGKRTNNDLQSMDIKLNIKQHKPYQKPGVNSGASGGKAVPAPLVALVVLI
jgi:hypothetical protein